MQNLIGNIRYALRQFCLSPVFTLAAVLTLALGIGGTTAIFTLMHALMVRSLPVSDPAQLYRIGDGADCCIEGGPQDRWGMFSYNLFERLRDAAPEFEQVTAFQAGLSRFSVRMAGTQAAAKALRSEYVSGNYFSTFGVLSYGGRLLSVADDKTSAAPVVVISHQLWQSDFAGNDKVLGSTMMIEGHPFTIVGVTPPGFFGDTLRGDPPQLWIPLQQEPLIAGQSSLMRQQFSAWLRAVGRLRPGASTSGLEPRLTGVLRRWMQHDANYPSNWMGDIIHGLPKQTVNVVPAGAGIAVLKEEYGRSLQILLAVCSLVLLVACANVANLLLARAVSRRTEVALRLALGADLRQVVGQALLEALLLSIAGGLTGIAVSMLAARLLLSLAFGHAQVIPVSIMPSPLVLLGALGVALLTALLFGAAPAWFATRTNPIEALRGAGRSTTDHSSLTRKLFLIAQVALSVVLVAGATMLGKSLNQLEHQDFGFRVDGRAVISLNRPPAGYSLPKLQSLYRRLEESLSQIPGVTGTGLAMYNPLTDNWGELILVAGHPAPKLDENAGASWDRVSTNYLQNFGVTLHRGRYFSDADNQNSAPVAIVNEAFVRRFFHGNENPLGQHFGLDLPENVNTFQIVGVVQDAKFAGFNLQKPARAMFYVPLNQTVAYTNPLMQQLEGQSHHISGMMLVTKVPPGILEPQVKRAVAAVDPDLTIVNVRNMSEQVAMVFDQERSVASLASLFGVVALLLAAVGLYGVTSYSVAQRTNEIGLRMALGADKRKVITAVLREALFRVAIGLVLGLPLAIGAARLISSQLYNVPFFDPPALGAASIALLFSAVIAASIPASFAASISPMVALRTD